MKSEKSMSLNGALLGAQNALKSVGKDAKNSFHGYNYTSSEGMISACRDALHANGLVVSRTSWRFDAGTGEFGMLISTFVLSFVDTNESVSAESCWFVVPEKGRPIDKALAGALTSSLNYYLRDLLLVPREEETMDSRDDTKYEPKARNQSERHISRPDSFVTAPQPAKSGIERLRERVADAEPVQAAPAPRAAAPAPRAAAPKQDDGEWHTMILKYVDQKTKKDGGAYLAVKDSLGISYNVWDENLFDVLLNNVGKEIQIIGVDPPMGSPANARAKITECRIMSEEIPF